MQFPESWLRAWADPDIDGQELAHRLTMAGLEVEDADPYAPPFSGVVVARIESAEPHPNADKLRVSRVDDGSGEPLQIDCGAPNAAAGLRGAPCDSGSRPMKPCPWSKTLNCSISGAKPRPPSNAAWRCASGSRAATRRWKTARSNIACKACSTP
ncbi:hypothetical protein CDEN61S_00180 [Castellaniella denitrificans]